MLGTTVSGGAPHDDWLRGTSALVLVCARDWGRPSNALLEAIRAELRGLGATLLVLSEETLFYFRPDQDAELIAEPRRLAPPNLEDLLRRHAGAEASSARLTLSVLDDEGHLRFRIARDIEDDVPEALLEALERAGRETLAAPCSDQLTRRELILGSLVGAFTLVLLAGCKHEPRPAPALAPGAQKQPAREVPIVLSVNGQEHRLNVEPRVSLLDVLRERMGLTGSKKGCDHGQCGACTVLLDDRRVNACLTLAVMAQQKRITTVEGLASGDSLHPLQSAFVEEDALQCGYCTPGQIMSALGLLKENRAHDDAAVREQMSGNLCRCGAYMNIVRAIQRARKEVPA